MTFLSGGAEKLTVLVTVKAYPSLSTKYGEGVCVAGVRLDTPAREWVRLFPVPFRDMPKSRQFRKWDIIEVEARRHSGDPRIETWRPNVDTVTVGDHVPSDHGWISRTPYIEHFFGPTMCELRRGRVGGGDGASLGLVRPREIKGIVVRAEEERTEKKRSIAAQGSLLAATPKRELDQIPWAFHYSYVCEDPACKGHEQKIADWEIGQAYRAWRLRKPEKDAIEDVKKKWLGMMGESKRDLSFFVGDQHQYPGGFMVLGTFYPERVKVDPQLDLFT
ncbi:MAG: hypothetical protein AAGC46_20960 [Solirubrobacteraceae bacterium]